jgi:4-hydroxy-tetrahydrodipicolinate reductase
MTTEEGLSPDAPPPPPPPLAIIGMGRMGQAIDALATARGLPVRARITAQDAITSQMLAGARVAIEFTTAAAAPAVVRACLAAGCAVVSGTTGWDVHMPAIRAEVLAAGGALLWAPNFAIGAHLLAAAGVQVARSLRNQATYDAAIVELHHARKRDAPSGTARTISHAVEAVWGEPIPITSVRTGHIPGEHEILFDGPFEQIRLVQSVRDRRVFAGGALTAAAWLVGRQGVFGMNDVLDLHTTDDRSARPPTDQRPSADR